MGRYYRGDIEGKFWFAVQSSDCAVRFGAMESEPSEIEYWFGEDEEAIKRVRDEIKVIKENIGHDVLKVLEKFFKENNGYNDKMLLEYLNKSIENKTFIEKDVRYLLHEFADLGFGKQVLKQLETHGHCYFHAEI